MTQIAEPEQAVAVLCEAVLIVENDRHVSRQVTEALEQDNIPFAVAETIADAEAELERVLSQNVQSLVILLDLMFKKRVPEEGIAFLRALNEYPEFRDDRINVIVLTAASDPDTRERVFAAGAKKFHAKSGDLTAVLVDIPLYLGRKVRTETSIVEVVDVDPSQREIEVRYRASEKLWVRCTLAYDDVPEPARVPGGSFYFDIAKRFWRGQMTTEATSRAVDAEEERERLSELLG